MTLSSQVLHLKTLIQMLFLNFKLHIVWLFPFFVCQPKMKEKEKKNNRERVRKTQTNENETETKLSFGLQKY